MFTAGRILRSSSNASRRNTIYAASPGAIVNKRCNVYRCYVPFVWQSLMTSIVGVTLMFGGITLCIVGFYATSGSDKATSGTVINDTKQSEALTVAAAVAVVGGNGVAILSSPHAEAVVERGQDAHVTSSSASGGGSSGSASMSYLGPVLMGVGCFAIIASVVVVCEVRERMLLLIDRLGLRRSRRSSTRDGNNAGLCRWSCRSLKLPFNRQSSRPEVTVVGKRHVEKLPFKRDLVGFISLPLSDVAAGRLKSKKSSVCFESVPVENDAFVPNMPATGELSRPMDTVITISESENKTTTDQTYETVERDSISTAPGLTVTRDDGTVEAFLQPPLAMVSQGLRGKSQVATVNCLAVSQSQETIQSLSSTDLHRQTELVIGFQHFSDLARTVCNNDQLDDVSRDGHERVRDASCFGGSRPLASSDDVIIELSGGSSAFRRRISSDSVLSTVHEALSNEDEDSSAESTNIDTAVEKLPITFKLMVDVADESSCLSAAVDGKTSHTDCKYNDIPPEISSYQVSTRHSKDSSTMMTTTNNIDSLEERFLEGDMEEGIGGKLPSSGAASSMDKPEIVATKEKTNTNRRASEPFTCQQQPRGSSVTKSNKPGSLSFTGRPANQCSRQQKDVIKTTEIASEVSNPSPIDSAKPQWSQKAVRLWSSEAYYLKTGRRQATKMSLPPASHSAVAIEDVMGCISSLKRSERDQASACDKVMEQ